MIERLRGRSPLAAASLFVPLFALMGQRSPCQGGRGPEVQAADVVIYGATSAGVVAAVRLAELGRTVLLVEPTSTIGGLSSSGLGATDIGNKAAIGGMSRAFYQAIREHYSDEKAWRHQSASAFRGRGHRAGEDAAWTFEPHVAEAVFREWLARYSERIALRTRTRIRLDGHGAIVERGRVRALVAVGGQRFEGRMFLDCSYEGDLMAAAGVDFVVGREANSTFGETLNGVQTARAVHHQFGVDVDPYVRPGDPDSGLLYGLQAEAPGPEGSGDRGLQAYCFRICATDVAANRIGWPRPPSYDAARYELLLRTFEAGETRAPWHPVRMPNGKTDSNNNTCC